MPGHAAPRAAARLRLPLLLIPWVACSGLLAAWLWAPVWLEQYSLYPLLAGIVLLGLPHGALDHVVPVRQGWAWPRRGAALLGFALGYALVAGLYLLLWPLAPLVAFWGFLALTVFHWGQGDLHFLESHLLRARRSRASAALAIAARGGLPIVVPLLAFPESFEHLAHLAAAAFGRPLAVALFSPGLLMGLGVLFGLLLVAYVFDTGRSAASRGACASELFEVGLLLVLFSTVPAPLAIGIYFPAWHALRHLGRLLTLRPNDARLVSRGRWWPPLLALARDLTPLTAVAIAVLAGLYLINAPRVASLEGLVALYLALIAALTLPHALVVAHMENYGP